MADYKVIAITSKRKAKQQLYLQFELFYLKFAYLTAISFPTLSSLYSILSILFFVHYKIQLNIEYRTQTSPHFYFKLCIGCHHVNTRSLFSDCSLFSGPWCSDPSFISQKRGRSLCVCASEKSRTQQQTRQYRQH